MKRKKADSPTGSLLRSARAAVAKTMPNGKFSQEAMARELGLLLRTYERYENGVTVAPGDVVLKVQEMAAAAAKAGKKK